MRFNFVSRRSLWILLSLVVLGAGYYYFAVYRSGTGATDEGKPRRGGAPAAVQVAPSREKDFEVWIDALGTVTSINTVTVHSRVDGELFRVNFKEGQMVKQGDLLAEIDPRPFQLALDQAIATLARDKALLDNARVDLERYRTLVAKDAAPRQQADTQQALVTQYMATVKSDEASIETAKLNLIYCHITAPLSGLVGLRQVDPGNIVHASDANGLVTITQFDPISVLFSIPQDLLPSIQKKKGAGLSVKALDRAGKLTLASGTLASMDSQIDATTGTIKMRALFDNKDRALFPNQFVNVRLRVETLPRATVIPISAVQTGAQGSFVYTLSTERKVSIHPVVLGPTDGQEAVVLKGVNAGDVVVIDGVDKLKDGMTVMVRSESSAGKDSGRSDASSKPEPSKKSDGTKGSEAPSIPASSDVPKEDGEHHHHHRPDGSTPTPEEREKWRQRHSSESKGPE